MNPNSQETPGIELPPPVPEQVPAASGSGEQQSKAAERAPSASERAPTASQPAAALPASPIPLPAPPTAPASNTNNDVSSATQAVSLTDEDDGDLIEKEWVNKAKQIVEQTRNDPYKQSEELTVFKADYMKKRYDKTIKVSR